MKKRILAVILVPAAACFSAERFFLVDNTTGEMSAAITFSNGAQAVIGSNAYTVKISDDKATETEALMRGVIIPSIEFRQAAIPDVINFLIASSRGGMARPRLNLLLHEEDPGSAPQTRTITLQLTRVSLYDALRIVCEKSGMSFYIDEDGFVQIVPADAGKP